MSSPKVSASARNKWGYFPVKAASVEAASLTKLSAAHSGMLVVGTSNHNLEIAKVADGVSFAFDARGGTTTVTLPQGELTSGGAAVVSITGVASLTKAAGAWTYAGS